MFKKIIAVLLVVALTATASIAGTLAYLQSDDSNVNVMTVGKVKIEQHEYQRVVEDGAYKTDTVDDRSSYVLEPFVQNKPLYPSAIEHNGKDWGWDDITTRMSQVGSYGGMQMLPVSTNAQDKFVVVENTGRSDAYVRTLVAIEVGAADPELIGITGRFDQPNAPWNRTLLGTVDIDGATYKVYEFLYVGAPDVSRHVNGVLPAGDTTYPSLCQVFLKDTASNDDCEKLDANGNGTCDILVISQAVQTNGFDNAATALETAYPKGENNANLISWFSGLEFPREEGEPAPANAEVEYNGTTYSTIYEAVAAANANDGGEIILKGSATLDKPVEITSNITLKGNGAAYTRAEGYTGTMLAVQSGSLTTENLTLDGAGATATGNLIAATGSCSIELNAGTVLQNNNGAHAVNLGTRIGATLTLNGAHIVNNSSDSGAIWGGGHITVNEGSKINNNSSTGSAGAIRMVSSCNLTMNGGEICGNTAVGNGGAIYGYGATTYHFNGGKMSDNTAAVGGAIYTGESSVINISGDFEMTGNTAKNSGAVRFTNRTTLNMTGGKISGNTSTDDANCDGFYGWNVAANITGGQIDDNFTLDSGLYCTLGGDGIDGVVYFALNTNHNTALLAENFGTFKFSVAEGNNFNAFNLKPTAGYTYTEGDEAKLICLNEGYSTYWDAATSTFKIKAN